MAHLISQLCGELHTAGCLLVQGICSHLKVTWALVDIWQASQTSHSKSNPGNFHQYMAELLVNISNYHLMVKSVSWCCVRARWLFTNLVTFCVWSFVIHCHTVIDKANKRIRKSIEDYHGWYILYASIEEPIEIGYLIIQVFSITEVQEQYN